MKLHVYKTVKSDVINVEFVSKDLHSVHWDIIKTFLVPQQVFFDYQINLENTADLNSSL